MVWKCNQPHHFSFPYLPVRLPSSFQLHMIFTNHVVNVWTTLRPPVSPKNKIQEHLPHIDIWHERTLFYGSQCVPQCCQGKVWIKQWIIEYTWCAIVNHYDITKWLSHWKNMIQTDYLSLRHVMFLHALRILSIFFVLLISYFTHHWEFLNGAGPLPPSALTISCRLSK